MQRQVRAVFYSSCFMLENPPVASRLGGGFSGGALVELIYLLPRSLQVPTWRNQKL